MDQVSQASSDQWLTEGPSWHETVVCSTKRWCLLSPAEMKWEKGFLPHNSTRLVSSPFLSQVTGTVLIGRYYKIDSTKVNFWNERKWILNLRDHISISCHLLQPKFLANRLFTRNNVKQMRPKVCYRTQKSSKMLRQLKILTLTLFSKKKEYDIWELS